MREDLSQARSALAKSDVEAAAQAVAAATARSPETQARMHKTKGSAPTDFGEKEEKYDEDETEDEEDEQDVEDSGGDEGDVDKEEHIDGEEAGDGESVSTAQSCPLCMPHHVHMACPRAGYRQAEGPQ